MTGETVLVGEFSHETNTFASEPTDRESFQKRREYHGDELIEELRGTNSTVGGIVDVAEGAGVELIPTVAAAAQPGGIVTEEAFEYYSERILAGVRDHRDDLDGICLGLHGAMVVEGRDDGEGPLLAAIREEVGDDVPITTTLDLHGNVTDEMIDHADALIAYETYPHVDSGETGRTAMRVLLDAMRDEMEPTMAIERPPVLTHGPKENTRAGPMAEVMASARELEERDGVRKVNVMSGFPKADVPSMGFSISVVADGDNGLATEVARDLATTIWERRTEFVGDYPDPAEAVSEAFDLAADADAPVVLADVGDNPGGGSAADGTTVLRELIDQGASNAGFAIMRDPEVVDACVDAGAGERVTVTMGGKTDDLHGEPIADVEGYVKAITDGRYRNTGPMGTGTRQNLGRAVRFECGADDGVTVIVTDNRVQPLDAEIWRHVGVQPERLDIIVVKSTNHYRADYEPMASHVLSVNSPGLCAMDPGMFDFEAVTRPKFPIDEMDDGDYPDWE